MAADNHFYFDYWYYFSVELASLQMSCGNRSAIYAHLAAYLPCSKDTLLKRAKTLRVKEMDDKIKGPLQKLKDGRFWCQSPRV